MAQLFLEEVSALKVRIKFSKTGALKFIGHLDVMRYFQKAFRRAEVDIAYSKGYSPHQLISFAAPLGIGLTSVGEYMDAEFNTTDSSEIMIQRINEVMADGITILEFLQLDDKTKNAMASVALADYIVSLRNGYYNRDSFYNEIEDFKQQQEILIVKKTKKSEKEIDIKPMIKEITQEADTAFLKVLTGSAMNLKPETVMEAYCNFKGVEYNKLAFMVHRTETYMLKNPDQPDCYVPLSWAGKSIQSEEICQGN